MSSGVKWRPGDDNNPYDPASMSENELVAMLQSFERDQRDPFTMQEMYKIIHDPVARKDHMDYLAEEMEDAERRGETMHERMRREKSEWAVRDALSLKLKNRGNDALKAGDVKKAWFMYSLALEKSFHEPAYHLNRAAAAIQLGLYTFAELDATQALKADAGHGPLHVTRFTTKAYFRRAQARRYMGILDEAEQGKQPFTLRVSPEAHSERILFVYIIMVLEKMPDDPAVIKEQKTICELSRLPQEELQAYRELCSEKMSLDAFKRIIGYTVEEIDGVLEKMREQEEYEDALNLD